MTRALRLAALVAAVLFALTAPAAAHGAAGTLGIEVIPGATPLTATVRVLLEYANDREVVPGATVVATATGPDGRTVGATPLADQGRGVYEGTLTLPAAGTWTVTVTATEPAATAQATVAVGATGTSPTTLAGTPLTRLADPGDVRTSSDRASRAERSAGGDDGGSSTAVIAVIAVVALVAAGAVVLVVRRRRV
ncbi:MAG: FixH family protein [Acidimicrobiia bacterium]|jgi:hypothetical protein